MQPADKVQRSAKIGRACLLRYCQEHPKRQCGYESSFQGIAFHKSLLFHCEVGQRLVAFFCPLLLTEGFPEEGYKRKLRSTVLTLRRISLTITKNVVDNDSP